jgi:hypothetical protein
MTDLSTYTHAWIRTNTKAAMDRTNVIAVVVLCFKTEPESRIALWYAKLPEKDSPEFTTPTFSLEAADGSPKEVECISGRISTDLIELAAAAQAKLRKELGRPAYGKLYKVGDAVEEMKK